MRLRRSLPQALRRLLQFGVIAFIVYSAFGGTWRNYKRAHNQARLVSLIEGEVWGELYAANEDFLENFGESAEASYLFLGFPWSGRFFGWDTADPILVASQFVTAGVPPGELLLAAALPVFLALLFGKLFCSHLCPARLLFELGQGARAGLLRLGVPLPEFRSKQRLGGFVLLGGLLSAAIAGTSVWLFILPYVSIAAGIFVLLTTGTLAVFVGAAAFWLFIDVFLAPGLFCGNVCPTGFVLEQLGRFSFLRLKKTGDEACPTRCDLCERACPYNLSPRQETHRPACDNCGKCVPACPKDRLRRTLNVISAVALFSLVGTSTALAHHNKGLPHYGYYENYPQVPTEEYVVIDGHWEMGATLFNFQGLDRTTADTPNDVKIYLYLYDLAADEGYMGPLDVSIVHDGVVVSTFERVAVDEEAVYSTRETMPESGDYELVAHIGDEVVTLPFHVELASDRVSWVVILAIVVPLLLLFMLALIGRRRRRGKSKVVSSGASAVLLLCFAALPFAAPASAQDVLALRTEPIEPLISEENACLCGDDDCVVDNVDIGPDGQPLDPSICPTCHRRDCTMTHYETDAGSVMVMGGVPLWLFLLGVAAIIGFSFVATERIGPRLVAGKRRDLLRRGRAYKLFRSRWFQPVAQLSMAAILGALTYVGLAGSRVANLAPVAVWTIWWAGLIFVVLLFASAWCFVCPWDGLANLVTRLRVAARVETLSLSLPFPKALTSLYPALVLFVLLTWLELGYGVTTNPRTTAYMGLAMAGLAIGSALLWDGKKFCAHLCPVGRVCGMYSNFAPIAIRARKSKACVTCTTEDCLNGNELGYPCPTGLSLKVLDEATHCTMCTECIKSCRRQNATLELRPFGSDLKAGKIPKIDEAWFALALLSLTLFHGLSMTPAWENFAPGGDSILKSLGLALGTPKVATFTIAMVVACAVPVAVYYVCCLIASKWAGQGVTTGTLFVRYAYSLLPVALFYHLSHNLMHLLMEGGSIVPMLSDPLGTGANYLGTAGTHPDAIIGESTLWYMQVGLIVVGHIFGIVVAHRFAHRLYDDKKSAIRSLLPMTAMMILVSVAGLSLMHLDMNMRVGRM